MINPKKLKWELDKLNIPIEATSADGHIDFAPEATVEQIAQAQLIVASHKPIWYVEERRKKYPPIGDQLDAIYKNFKSNNVIIPGFTDLIDQVKTQFPKE